MNFYNEIKNKLIDNDVNSKVKDYLKNKNSLTTYYSVGRLLNDAGKCYGKGIIKRYSEKLSNELNKKYSTRTLYNMRLYYIKFSENEILQPLAAKLSWSHYCELLRFNDPNKIVSKEYMCI